MHRWLFLGLICSLSAAGVFGCVERDPAPLYIDVSYQVRCLDCEPRAPDNAKRDIQLLNGEQGYTVSCRASRQGGDRLLSFETAFKDPERSSNNFSLSILTANLDSKGPGSDCRVQVVEGANTYEGDCTGGDPSASKPCKVDFSVEDDIVTGSVLCEEIPNRTTAMTKRYLVAPGSRTKAAKFELHGCTGL